MKNLVLVSLGVLLLGCNSKPQWVKNQNIGNALGTTYSIIYLSDEELDFQRQIDSVFQVVNLSMSTYIPNSDISKINDGDSTVIVDQMFKEVFELSSKVYKASEGYFDPSIGVLANAWGFGPGEPLELDSLKLDSLLNYVGWDKVSLNTNGTISKLNPNIRFDFNAIAKGYAIDRLGAMLQLKGIENYLVEVGGEVLAKGMNTVSKKEWTVGIDSPNDMMNRGVAAIINLKDRALASSGNYRKFRIDLETGAKYVHTINPLTGYTKNSKVLAASVVAADCATADAYATAFMAMDLENSISLLESKKDLEAYIVYLGEKDSIQTFLTPGFEEVLVK
ncbi:FAD:protein FMN transferase [Croceitalea rosinachiae]|uniref:FAD:protein FMN transferase n=1 Tax=Croceitalea rosinachiae TaxID=3075596 RepID=A0ABU3A5D9_9FLAO|nr:FAD:protein FMN transferase [Croceitalea sp. F388]MDT0605397.1 FAD:protein FMN transferase [Croceitalea sp. F388]